MHTFIRGSMQDSLQEPRGHFYKGEKGEEERRVGGGFTSQAVEVNGRDGIPLPICRFFSDKIKLVTRKFREFSSK